MTEPFVAVCRRCASQRIAMLEETATTVYYRCEKCGREWMVVELDRQGQAIQRRHRSDRD